MTFRMITATVIGLAAAFHFIPSPTKIEDKITLARNFGAQATVTYRVTSAETYTLGTDAKETIEVHGAHDFTVSLEAAKDQKDVWAAGLEATKFFWSAKSKGMSNEWKSDAVMTWPKAAKGKIAADGVNAGECQFDAAHPGSLEKDNDARVGAVASGMNWLYRTNRQFDLAFPAFGKDAIGKDGRFDGEMLVGAVAEHDVRAFFANVVKSFDDKSATLISSGKPKFVKSGRAAGANAYTLNEEKSYWSHEVTIERATGLVAKREGEVFLDLSVGKDAAHVTAKVWMRLEKVAAK